MADSLTVIGVGHDPPRRRNFPNDRYPGPLSTLFTRADEFSGLRSGGSVPSDLCLLHMSSTGSGEAPPVADFNFVSRFHDTRLDRRADAERLFRVNDLVRVSRN